ncbi:hypothetical protein COP1_013452 [Malus domestica]
MDACLTALETSIDALFISLESTIAAALFGHAMAMDTKLAVGFEQFQRELAFTDGAFLQGRLMLLLPNRWFHYRSLLKTSDC